jgi:hypothetical protein
MIQQCIDLALGRAFTPDPLDPTVPLSRRFAKRPLVAVTIYKDRIEASAVTFNRDAPAFSPPESCATGGEDVDAAFLRSFAERHKARECLMNVTTGYTAVLSSRARRPESDEEAIALMRDNPDRLLGEPPAQGCRHSLAFHPTHNFAVAFAHREHDINTAVSLASKADLAVARVQCGMASLLVHILGSHWSEVGREAEILFVDRASLFYMPAAEGSFGRPLFDIGLKEAALAQAIEERVGRLKPGGKAILVDSSGLEVETMIQKRAADIDIAAPLREQAQPALLACCSDKPRLGYDLYPNERAARPFAPVRLRAVPVVLWGSVAASVAIAGINGFRAAQADRLAAGLQGQAKMLDEARKQTDGVVRSIQARGKAADSICNWLLISPSTQSVLIDITKEIQAATEQGIQESRPVAQVDSLSLTRQEGQPQMRFVLVVLGDASAANRVFQRISALFGRLGYSTVDLKESLVPQGFRYEHLLNIPRTSGS